MAQIVTSGPTCCCTTLKFCRKAGSETSAHVGRVACRIALPVIVVATPCDYRRRNIRTDVTQVLLSPLQLPEMRTEKGKGQSCFHDWPLFMPATTYSPTHLARAVQSALRGLTSVFEMGTGGSPAVRSPTTCSRQSSVPSRQLKPGPAPSSFAPDGDDNLSTTTTNFQRA
jgi:hypothetical protein